MKTSGNLNAAFIFKTHCFPFNGLDIRVIGMETMAVVPRFPIKHLQISLKDLFSTVIRWYRNCSK
jgi:hypothetical protein